MNKKIICFFIVTFLTILNAEVFKLKNGIDVVYKKVEGINVVSVGVLFKGGSAKYEKGMDGIEVFALNSVLEGTKSHPYPEFQRILTREGIEHYVNARRDFSYVIFKSPLRSYKKAISLLKEALSEPELNPDRIEIVRKRLISNALRRQESPNYKLQKILDDVFFKNHPYSVDPQGNVETLSKFKIEDVQKFLENNFHAGGIVIGVVGPVEREEIEKLLNDAFGSLEYKELKMKSVPDFIPMDTLIYEKEPNYKTTYISCRFPLPDIKSPDYPALLASFEILSNRFWEKVRTKAGISYAVGASVSSGLKSYGMFYVSSSLPDSAWKLMIEEVEKIKKEGIKEKELKQTISMWRSYRLFSYSQTDRQLTTMLSSYVLTGDPEYTLKLIEKIKNVKVGDIRNVFNKYFKKYTICRLGP